MKNFLLAFILLLASGSFTLAQTTETPDKIYGQLFVDVQMNRIFPDNKTFVDCVPKRDPAAIVEDYMQIKKNPAIKFSLQKFVEENFEVPVNTSPAYKADTTVGIKEHIRQLWQVLKRNPDKAVKGSSLLPLPNPYIVPGGRFREIYYWDSYFTMLGLQESGENETVENMIQNFAYMIQQYGHIPNGNRTYYLSRSQPPYFSMMIELLSATKGNMVYALYKDALQKEYDYWMDKTAPTKHVVKMPDGSILNRYWDQSVRPRQESFYQDSTTGKEVGKDLREVYRNLRSCAESGWDFSSRWFADGVHLTTIQVTNIIPLDLNGFLYHLELTLAKCYKETGNLLQSNYYNQLAERRKKAINKYCWNAADKWYYDYNISENKMCSEMTIAGTSPLFFNVASAEQAKTVAQTAREKFLKPGGFVTTLKTTGQQWDAPNGWAPLEWIAIKGLENYNEHELAKEAAARWAELNMKVYRATGKMMEKYNVADTHLEAGGGEYPSQDGFGWSNGVLLKLMDMYGIKEQ